MYFSKVVVRDPSKSSSLKTLQLLACFVQLACLWLAQKAACVGSGSGPCPACIRHPQSLLALIFLHSECYHQSNREPLLICGGAMPPSSSKEPHPPVNRLLAGVDSYSSLFREELSETVRGARRVGVVSR